MIVKYKYTLFIDSVLREEHNLSIKFNGVPQKHNIPYLIFHQLKDHLSNGYQYLENEDYTFLTAHSKIKRKGVDQGKIATIMIEILNIEKKAIK